LKKISLYRHFGVDVCLDGIMFKIFYWQNEIDAYVDMLERLNLALVEVSNGSFPISKVEKRKMVSFFAKKRFIVISETGSKDVSKVSPPEEWGDCFDANADCGAQEQTPGLDCPW